MVKPVKALSRGHQRLNKAPEDRLPPGLQKMPIWDEVIEARDSLLGGCLEIGQQIGRALEFIRDSEEVYAFVKDKNHFINLINQLNKDYADNEKKINDIFASHSNRRGYATNPDDHALALATHGRYGETFSVFQSVAMPSIAELTEIITSAVTEHQEAVKAGMLKPQENIVTIEASPVNDQES